GVDDLHEAHDVGEHDEREPPRLFDRGVQEHPQEAVGPIAPHDLLARIENLLDVERHVSDRISPGEIATEDTEDAEEKRLRWLRWLRWPFRRLRDRVRESEVYSEMVKR